MIFQPQIRIPALFSTKSRHFPTFPNSKQKFSSIFAAFSRFFLSWNGVVKLWLNPPPASWPIRSPSKTRSNLSKPVETCQPNLSWKTKTHYSVIWRNFAQFLADFWFGTIFQRARSLRLWFGFFVSFVASHFALRSVSRQSLYKQDVVLLTQQSHRARFNPDQLR